MFGFECISLVALEFDLIGSHSLYERWTSSITIAAAFSIVNESRWWGESVMGWFIISPDVRFRVCFSFAIAFVWDFLCESLLQFRCTISVLHCGMPATGRELAQLQRLNSHHSQDCWLRRKWHRDSVEARFPPCFASIISPFCLSRFHCVLREKTETGKCVRLTFC